MSTPHDLPPDIAAKLMACWRRWMGTTVSETRRRYLISSPSMARRSAFLRELITVNLDAVVKYYEETGAVPPGIKLIRTTTAEGSNVVGLDVLRGERSKK